MEDLFRTMAYPFLACLLLTGIHVYLGIHVIARKIIFVDLALAQIAAFGAVFGVLLGYGFHEDPWAVKGFSLLFAVIGAFVFAVTRPTTARVPHEALIGITYAVALAATVLASAQLPHGGDDLRDLLSGSILWVTGETLVFTLALYAFIGALHFVFRERFFQISFRPGEATSARVRVRAWDFLFYVLFGFVVTSSVAIAGVLLVFAYLVIPAVMALLFADRLGTRLAIGWSVGTAVSLAGVFVSYEADLPSGPTIVVGLAAALVLAGAFDAVRRSERRVRTVTLLLAGALGLAAVLVGTAVFFHKEHEYDPLAALEGPSVHERRVALERARDDAHLWQRIRPRIEGLLIDPDLDIRVGSLELVGRHRYLGAVPAVVERLQDEEDEVREAAIDALRELGAAEATDALVTAALTEPDDFLKARVGETLLDLADPRGFPVLMTVINSSPLLQARRDAHQMFASHLRDAPEVDPESSPGDGRRAEILSEWWRESGPRLQWNEEAHQFEETP